MIRRHKLITEELITKDQNLNDCILVDCKIEKGAIVQKSLIIIDGEKVSLDCPCLNPDYQEPQEEEEDA